MMPWANPLPLALTRSVSTFLARRRSLVGVVSMFGVGTPPQVRAASGAAAVSPCSPLFQR